MPAALWKRQGYKSQGELGAILFRLYWKENYSQSAIAKKLNCHITCIENWFKKLAIKTRNQSERTRIWKKREVELSSSEQEILDGLILSDLHIEDGIFQSRLSFGFKYREFADSVIKHLSSLEWTMPKYCETSLGWHSNSKFYINLHIERSRWYSNNRKKIVPLDLKITPSTLLWWYLGDGQLVEHGYGALLCTDDFNKEENKRLVELINHENIPCHLTPNNRIRIKGKGGVKELLLYIGECPVVCYKYKWAI